MVLTQGIRERLEALHIPFDFALEHMFNIAFEFGVFLRVDKSKDLATAPPEREFGESR